MQSIKVTINQAGRRPMLAAPLMVLMTLATASCGESRTGLDAPAQSAVSESASGPTTATPNHPKFITVNVGKASELDGVNDAGTLVGTVYIDGNDRGFIMVGNKVTEFDYPGTSDVTAMSGINNSGTSIGDYNDNIGANRGFERSPDGRFTRIDDPNAGAVNFQGTTPTGINDAGVIVGTYIDPQDVEHGFVDTGGVFTTVNAPGAGTTGGFGTFVEGINNAGSIIGYYVDPHRATYGFVDSSGTFTSFTAPVGPVKGRDTRATALANDGVATGFDVDVDAYLKVTAWLRDGQVFYALNDPDASSGGGDQGTQPAAISQDGREVVGKYFDAKTGILHGFIAYI